MKCKNCGTKLEKGDRSFDDIMTEWNQAWSNAQKKNSVETE